eukprot:TRINITY_DN517_c5_g1_i1.p1 TRINITY_DN517_c5_g1~~TRINITY_DN517_c5_g1_i1.p1  ORF type:complete len:1039 (+),score=242.45 TRINITY_DN517_c5_g1_i1:90-3206(+)
MSTYFDDCEGSIKSASTFSRVPPLAVGTPKGRRSTQPRMSKFDRITTRIGECASQLRLLEEQASEGIVPSDLVLERYLEVVSKCITAACCQDPPDHPGAKALLDSLDSALSEEGTLGILLTDDIRLRLLALYYGISAVFYKHLGDWDSSIRFCTRSLHLFKTTPNSQPTDIAAAALNMAAVLGRQGKHRSAVQHARNAIQNLESAPGARPMLAVAYYNLAVELQYCRDISESRNAIARAYKISKTCLSPREPAAVAIAALYRNNTQRRPSTVVPIKLQSNRDINVGIPLQELEPTPPKMPPLHEAVRYSNVASPSTSRHFRGKTGGSISEIFINPNADGFSSWEEVSPPPPECQSPEKSNKKKKSPMRGRQHGNNAAAISGSLFQAADAGTPAAAGSPSSLPPIGSSSSVLSSPRSHQPHPPAKRNSSRGSVSMLDQKLPPSPSSCNSQAFPEKKRRGAAPMYRNIGMSKQMYGQTFKKCQKHLSAIASSINSTRVVRERAAITIQKAVRCCNARLELYNRKQLLYHHIYEKQSFMSNIIKGRIQCWKAQKWLAEKKVEMADYFKNRAEYENEQDKAATMIARNWKYYYARQARELKELVFTQALVETRMKKLAKICQVIQRWWRWVNIRKKYWRRRTIEHQNETINNAENERRIQSAKRLQAVWRGVLGYREAKNYRHRLAMEAKSRIEKLPYATDVVKFVLKSVAIRTRRQRELQENIPTEYELAMQREEKEAESAARIVEGWKRYRDRKESALQKFIAEQKREAAVRIQKNWKRYHAMKKLRVLSVVRCVMLQKEQEEEARREWCAVEIQCWWRGTAARERILMEKATSGRQILSSVEVIQRAYRSYRARKSLRRLRCERLIRRQQLSDSLQELHDHAARMIQCGWRRWRGRRQFRIRLAEHQRCKEIARQLAEEELVLYDIGLFLQRVGRAFIERRQLIPSLSARSSAAATIQRAWKCYHSKHLLEKKRILFKIRYPEMRFASEFSSELLQFYLSQLCSIEHEEREMEMCDECDARRYLLDNETAASSSSGCYD